MNEKIKVIFLAIILVQNFSCAENKSTVKETYKQDWMSTSKTDTLKFTSAIRAIFQDSKGNYWIGSHDEGVSLFNSQTFEYFNSHNGLSGNQIRSIQEDQFGNIWVSTSNGISVYNNGRFTNYPSKNNKPIADWNRTQGNLWFYAWEEDGINRFDGVNMNYLIFPKPKQEHSKSFGVTGISKSKNGIIWIATYSALFSYDNERVTIFDEKKLKLKNNEQLHIRSVLADSKGRIWIGNNGIGVLLMVGDSVINFSESNKLIHPTSTKRGDNHSKPGTLEHPFAIEEDSNGNIWFGDVFTGAWQYDGHKLTNYSIGNQQANPMIWTIYKDTNNNLLLGTAEGGIYNFNGKTFDKWRP